MNEHVRAARGPRGGSRSLVDLPAHRNRVAGLRADRVPVGLHDGLRDLVPVRRRRDRRGRERVLRDLHLDDGLEVGARASSACSSSLVGIYALVHPYDTFATLAALVGLFLLFKGIFDITVAFVTKERVRALVAPARDRPHRDPARLLGRRELPEKAILLVVYVGIIALARGISEIFVAFKLKGLRRRLAAA